MYKMYSYKIFILDQIGLGKLSMKAHYMDYHITLSGKHLRI